MARRKSTTEAAAVEKVDEDGVVQPVVDHEREKRRAQQDKITDKLLDSAQDYFKKKHSDRVVQRLSAADTLSRVETWVSSGSLVVDSVLVGGRDKRKPQSLIPFGRQTEISGLNGTGKTSLCAQIAAQVQAMGGLVAVTDTEERIDHHYWKQLGVDTDRILNLTARSLEDVFNIQIEYLQWAMKEAKNQPIMMLWDSLGGTTTDSLMDELESGGDIQETARKIMMTKAKIISNNMEIINPLVAQTKVAYIYTNTLYLDPMVKYGDPWKTPGGNRKDFFATVRLRLKKVGQISDKDESLGKKTIHGHDVVVESVKNSMAPKTFALKGAVLGNRGFCDGYTVKDIAETMGFVVTKGSWTTWTGENFEAKFQGWEGFLEAIEQYPEEYQKLRALVAAAL